MTSPRFPEAGWLGSLIARQISRLTADQAPPRPITPQERQAALEPEIRRRRASSEDMARLHRHFEKER